MKIFIYSLTILSTIIFCSPRADESVSYFEKFNLGGELSRDEAYQRILGFHAKYENYSMFCKKQLKGLETAKSIIELDHSELVLICWNDLIYGREKKLIYYTEKYLTIGVDPTRRDQLGVSPIVNSVFMNQKEAYDAMFEYGNKQLQLKQDVAKKQFHKLLERYVLKTIDLYDHYSHWKIK